jgi:hypothetical protein
MMAAGEVGLLLWISCHPWMNWSMVSLKVFVWREFYYARNFVAAQGFLAKHGVGDRNGGHQWRL